MRHSLGRKNTTVDKAVDGSLVRSLFESEGTSSLSKQGSGQEYYKSCRKDHEVTAITSTEMWGIVLTVITIPQRPQTMMHPVNCFSERELFSPETHVRMLDTNPHVSSRRMIQMGQNQQLNLECFQKSTTMSHLSGSKVARPSKKKGSLDVKSRKNRDGSILGPQISNASQDFSLSSSHLDGSDASSSIKTYTDSSKSDKSFKRLSKKKKRKKNKHNLKNNNSGMVAAVHEENAQGFTPSGSGLDAITFSGSGQTLTYESLEDAEPLDSCVRKNYKNYDDARNVERNIISSFIEEANDPEVCTIPRSKGITSSTILCRADSGTGILHSDNYVHDNGEGKYKQGSAEIVATSGHNVIPDAHIEESMHQLGENDEKHCCPPIECMETILAPIATCHVMKHCTDQLRTLNAQEALEQSRDAKIPSIVDQSASSGTNCEGTAGNISDHNCGIVTKGKRMSGSHGIGNGTSSSSTHANEASGKPSFEDGGGSAGNCCRGDSGMHDSRYNNEIEMLKDIMAVDNHEKVKHSTQPGGIREAQDDIFDRKVRVAGDSKMGGNTNGMDSSSSESLPSFDMENVQSLSGKEHNYSVWQKVQKSVEDDHTYKPKTINCFGLQSGAVSQNGSLVIKCTAAESNVSAHIPLSSSQNSNCECTPKEHRLKEQEIHKEYANSQGDVACYDVQSRFAMQVDLPQCKVSGDDSSVRNLPVLAQRQTVGDTDAYATESGKAYRAKKMGSSRSDKVNQFSRKGSSDVSQQSNQSKSFHSGGRNLQYIKHRKAELPGTCQGHQPRSSSAPSTPHRHVDTLQVSRGSFTFARSKAPMQAMLNQVVPLSRTSNSVDQAVLFTNQEGNPITSNGKTLEVELVVDENSFHSLPWKRSKSKELEIGVPPQINIEQDCTSQQVSQKWVPIETKCTGVVRGGATDKVRADSPDNVFTFRRANDSKQKEYDSSGQGLVSSANSHIIHANTNNNFHKQANENDESVPRDYAVQPAVAMQETGTSSSGHVEQITTMKNGCIYEVPGRCLSEITCDASSPDGELKKMSQTVVKAVHASYHYQLASEDIARAIGSPLAEFEKLLHCMSPVIRAVSHREQCSSHSRNQLMRNLVCKCQVGNILLKNIWHWYEKPGNYGLEVKAEDFQHPERMGIDGNLFRAYFVPFLSGMQLFGVSTSQSVCKDAQSNIEQGRIKETGKVKDSYLPQFGNLPILATLLPKPSSAEGMNLSVSSGTMDTSDSSACDENHSCNTMPEDFDFDGIDLLFEYFESEQPQQRRPMFEKIRELTKCDTSSSSQVFGDPHILESINLQDLHPASWFSVAWYPIYRIPEGHLRAAFLTYHSLSHFAHRSTSSNTLNGCTNCCIVAPVVGLQSYNTRAECWFVPKKQLEFGPEEGMPSNPLEVLEERLRTLEETASVMARGFRKKGTASVPNRRTDYEFFLSRKR